jgi:hypothetical protein
VSLAVDEALEADVEHAAERWSAATGCEVQIASPGAVGTVAVRLAASIPRPDGSEAPGATSEARDEVLVLMRLGARQRASTVLHELGHALGGDHTEGDGVLSGAKRRRDVIDAPALESVCGRLACGRLAPE